METNTEKQATEMINSVIKSKITESERQILEVVFSSFLKDSKELKELKESDLNAQLLEQKQISKLWIDKFQDLKKEHERILYQTGRKKIVKDHYLSARGERLDW